MDFFSLLVFTAAWAFVSSASLRAGVSVSVSSQAEDPQLEDQHVAGISTTNRRRRLTPRTTCKLYFSDIEFGPDPRYSEDQWICELPPEESSRLGGLKFVDIVDSARIIGKASATATSGKSTLTVSRSFIDFDEPKMYIPEGAHTAVNDINIDSNKYGREHAGTNTVVPSSIGTLSTLMIRVIDSNGIAPDASIAELERNTFEDEVCLKSQFEACSYGKLKIEPFIGQTNPNSDVFVKNGVIDVHVDCDVSAADMEGDVDRSYLQGKAIEAANTKLGDLNDPKYGLVMFCMPPGSGDWAANALVNHKYSFFNNNWCLSVSAHIHEIGHNLGLAHSGEMDKYDDQTGFMGYSYAKEDGPKMCYNPAKSYQLGWYNDKVKTIDPLAEGKPVHKFIMNGVSDYKKNANALVVLRFEETDTSRTEQNKDYYIGYNRKDGINEGTVEDPDMITIVWKKAGIPTAFGLSTKVAKLQMGQSYTIRNFNGQSDVEVRYLGNRKGDATIRVVDVDKAPDAPKEPPCANHTIELVTDNYPADTIWHITEVDGIGRFVIGNPEYKEKLTKYTTEVCLKHNTLYHFLIADKYGDGICCGQGNGSYTIRNSKGTTIVSSVDVEKFSTKMYSFRTEIELVVPTVAPVPAPTPTLPPTQAQAPVPVPTLPPTPLPVLPTPVPSLVPPTPLPTPAPTLPPTPVPTLPPTPMIASKDKACKDKKKRKFRVKRKW
eukprot:CAMPEP_0168300058 /NCGR_PEP_ID=MMETSP0142_2-20121227/29328_1 /TAXON_ID=44445 /ORGANISM="Pseudo-nitzschia australis, Strain 10249 10 AB" /LENGTH=716 /DNA_ID=CAMNT_0008249929 /DNA_START=39 /DNA_END=2186 /DNA_ORIENTATION=+